MLKDYLHPKGEHIKNIEITGLIGLGCGFVGFVLTLVYIIESSLVFTDIDDSYDLRIDSDGAVLELKGNEYKCIFYDKDDKFSLFRRYSDYGNKYLNYKKEVRHKTEDNNYEFMGCTYSKSGYIPLSGISDIRHLLTYPFDELFTYNELCKELDQKIFSLPKIEYEDNKGTRMGDCTKLYYFNNSPDYEKKNKYDRWLTSIILSCFALIFNIGIAIFGFLLFNSSGKTNL